MRDFALNQLPTLSVIVIVIPNRERDDQFYKWICITCPDSLLLACHKAHALLTKIYL